MGTAAAEFWQALADPQIGFLRTAIWMGLLSSLAFGITGTLVVVKRISYVAGAISHAVLGGIGAALYLQRAHGVGWMHPLLGAFIAAIIASLLIAWVRQLRLAREDSIIGAIWASGMAIGLVFISLTPGFIDPMSYLFGNILILSAFDLYWVAGLDVALLLVLALRYPQLEAVAFDEDQARLRGIRVAPYYAGLLVVVACTVVLLVSVVGIVLVVALLTIPAAMASYHARSLLGVMWIASAFAAAFISVGIFFSFVLDWPAGPTIILTAAVSFIAATALRALR